MIFDYQNLNLSSSKRSDKIGYQIKNLGRFIIGAEILKGVIWTVLLAVGFFYLTSVGVPKSIGYFFIGIFVIILILKIFSFRKLASTHRYLEKIQTQTMPQHQMSIDSEEKIQASIGGVMKTNFTQTSMSVAPTITDVISPENIILITDKHFLFIYLSSTEGNNMILGLNMPMMNWLVSSDELKQQLEESLSKQSLNDVFQSYPKNFAIKHEDIQSIEFQDSKQSFILKTNDGKEYQYAIREAAEYEKAKNALDGLIELE